MHQIATCPICKSNTFSGFLICKDHTVSHETFNLVKCKTCGFVLTNPRPENSQLSKYYESSDYISHSNTSSSLFDKVYQISRHLTLSWKISLITKYLRKDSTIPSVLDYGCGTGEFLSVCCYKRFATAGVEPSQTARSQAASRTNSDIASDVSQISDTFDVITLWHVLEHIHDLNEKISVLKSLLKKNGTMFIAVPNHNSRDAKYYGHLWAGYDVPRHLWHFNVQSMTLLLKNHGLKVEAVVPMKLDAFYVSMLSEKYKAGKQSLTTMILGAWNGLKSNLAARNKNYSSQIFVVRK
jgi:SAM-dependent methyltransferase